MKSQTGVKLQENMIMICFQIWKLSKQGLFNGHIRNSYPFGFANGWQNSLLSTEFQTIKTKCKIQTTLEILIA